MKKVIVVLFVSVVSICSGQSLLVATADSLFELGQYEKAAAQFQLASIAYKKAGNWKNTITCLDAQRVCWESRADWGNAFAVLQKSYRLSKDSLNEKFDYNTIAYSKNSAIQINLESLQYFEKALRLFENWRGADELVTSIQWYCFAGYRLMQETYLSDVRYRLNSDNLISAEENHYDLLNVWLKRLLDKKLIRAERLVASGQDSSIFFYTKSLINRDSSLWNLYRAAEEWIKTGNFNSDSVFLSFLMHWENKEPDQTQYHQLLGWYEERNLNYDAALEHYSECSSYEYNECLVRKAKAFKNGLLSIPKIMSRDTAKANLLFKKATKSRKKKEYGISGGLWFEAAIEFIKLNCWNRAYQCIYNAGIDEYKDEMGGDVSKYLSLAQKLIPVIFQEGTLEYGKANWQVGQTLLSRNENHYAFEHLFKAVPVFESSQSNTVQLALLYFEIGNASKNLMDFETAIRFHEKSLSLYNKMAVFPASTINDLNLLLAEEYYEVRDYEPALHHLQRITASTEAQHNKQKWVPLLKYMEGKIFLSQKNESAAVKSFEEARKYLYEDQFRKFLDEYNRDPYDLNFKTLDKLYDANDFGKLVDLRQRILNSMASLIHKNPSLMKEIELVIDNNYLNKNLTRYTLIKSLNLLGFYKLDQGSNIHQRSNWLSESRNLNDSTNLDTLVVAWDNFSRAIMLNSINNYNPQDITAETMENPPLGIPENPAINSYQYGDLLLESYLGRARICFQYFEYGYDSIYLWYAQKYILKCDSILSRARNFFTNESSKLNLAESGAKVYELGAKVSYMMAVNEPYQRDNVFQFMEKGKSNILRQSLAEVKAQYYSGVPDSLLSKERSFRTKLFELYRKLADSKQNVDSGDNMTQLDSLKEEIFTFEQLQLNLSASLEKNYPNYFNLKSDHNLIESSWSLSDALQEDEALIEYMLGEENIFIAICSKGKRIQVNAIASDTLLPRYIKGLRNSISFQSKDEFIQCSNWLYEKIFAGVDRFLDKLPHIKKLIIIPDNLLGYIPFEVLMPKTQTSEYASLPYLIKKFEIRYAYSATMFLEQSRYQPLTEDSAFVAFAPVFNDSNKTNFLVKSCERFYQHTETPNQTTRAFSRDGKHITPLPHTEGEVRQIAMNLKRKDMFTKFFVFKDAREEVLKSDEMIRYKYIHMATHGIINDHFPAASGLLLSQDSTGREDGILYTGEIYAIKLNADMVVLSACETGLGKVVKGEGILGITRGWLYAGAKNLVVSLWKVADESTAVLMVDFYNYLFSGKSKAEALQQAKLKMINESKYNNPYFWAPFILIGN